MIFTKTPLLGAFIIEIEKFDDKRGFFARTFEAEEFKKYNLTSNFNYSCISFNKKKATLRGLHYQKAPNQEVKLVRCTKGSVFDVIIDLRPKSKSYKKYFGIVLKDSEYRMLYIPKDFAHGFITLEDNSEIFYQISGEYNPSYAKGIRWDDPTLKINWPVKPEIISDSDKNLPFL